MRRFCIRRYAALLVPSPPPNFYRPAVVHRNEAPPPQMRRPVPPGRINGPRGRDLRRDSVRLTPHIEAHHAEPHPPRLPPRCADRPSANHSRPHPQQHHPMQSQRLSTAAAPPAETGAARYDSRHPTRADPRGPIPARTVPLKPSLRRAQGGSKASISSRSDSPPTPVCGAPSIQN